MANSVKEAIELRRVLERASITQTHFGGYEHVSFKEWATDTIQDEEEAIKIAQSMLENLDGYSYNEEGSPRDYMEFEILNESVLRIQIGVFAQENF